MGQLERHLRINYHVPRIRDRYVELDERDPLVLVNTIRERTAAFYFVWPADWKIRTGESLRPR